MKQQDVNFNPGNDFDTTYTSWQGLLRAPRTHIRKANKTHKTRIPISLYTIRGIMASDEPNNADLYLDLGHRGQRILG